MATIVNSMIVCVLRCFLSFHSSRVITNSRFLLAKGIQYENIQTSSSSFGKKRLNRVFCSTNKIVVANLVLGVDPTFQYGRSNRLTATGSRNVVIYGDLQVYSQIKTVRPRCSISFH